MELEEAQVSQTLEVVPSLLLHGTADCLAVSD